MRKIVLSPWWFSAIVDDEDYEKLWMFDWRAVKATGSNNIYAMRKDGRKTIWMHRVIMNTPDDMQCDHIYHDTLDNRKSQLRNVTQQQNQWNQKISKANKTGAKGVSWHTKDKKYRAQIKLGGVRIHLGQFDTIQEASIAYEQKARELFGEYRYQEPPLAHSEITPKSNDIPAVRTSNVATMAAGERL